MKAPFKTKTIYTYPEYFRFNRAILFSRGTLLKMAALEACIVAASAVTRNPFLLIFCVAFPLIVMLLQNFQIKKAWQSNKVVQNVEINFAFYDSYFTQRTRNGESQLAYDKLHGYIENSTNMYLMISRGSGYILCKSDFPQGLAEHLRSVAKRVW